jgi:threonine/homoserine/homoserine lactone efflux protein
MKRYQYCVFYMLLLLLGVAAVNHFPRLIGDILSALSLAFVAWIVHEIDHAVPMPDDYEE